MPSLVISLLSIRILKSGDTDLEMVSRPLVRFPMALGCFCVCFALFFETGFHCVAKVGFVLEVFLPQPQGG